jgi:hypothetical protein
MKKNKLLPSTILYKVNFKYIIDHCLDKEMWKQSWPLMEYDGLSIDLRLLGINIEDNDIQLSVRTTDNTKEHFYWNKMDYSFNIPLDISHYNDGIFIQKLNAYVITGINYFERNAISRTKTYEQAKKLDEDAKERFENGVNERLDNLNILDDEIRKAFIDKKLKDFDDFKEKELVISEMQYRFRLRYYLNYFTVSGQREKYDEFAQKYAKKSDMLKINLEMQKYSEYIKSNNLLKEME